MNIVNVKKPLYGCRQFTITGIDKSFVNGLRRTLLGNIPILVMKAVDCDITVNTSRFTNEIIKDRLASIPINQKLSGNKPITVTVSKKNTTTNVIFVTTEDFDTPVYEPTIIPNFPGKHFIDFIRLRPGEEIQLTCTSSIGTSNESGMYNSVGTCSFNNTHDKNASDAEWNSTPRESRADWELLEAKRFSIPNSFDFIMETIGTYTNDELLLYAGFILKNQFDACQKPKNIIASPSTIHDCFDVTITGDYFAFDTEFKLNGDYTTGKMIEYAIYKRFKNPITYVAYFKRHPHDTTGILRVAYPNATRESVEELINDVCKECIVLVNTFTQLIKTLSE